MLTMILGAFIIMFMRMADVTLGTFRTLLVVQGKKYYAALTGFVEVTIWIFMMRYIVDNMNDTINLFAYATGFALGNIIGIFLEEKIGLGYVQINIISKHDVDRIADKLRLSKIGVTLLPAEGGSGGTAVLVAIIKRRDLKYVIKLVEEIDPKCFISIQHSRPYRGYVHGARK